MKKNLRKDQLFFCSGQYFFNIDGPSITLIPEITQ